MVGKVGLEPTLPIKGSGFTGRLVSQYTILPLERANGYDPLT